ncbi:MAG: MarR family transcriptional regulator [Thermoanaerobaculia bacterium]|nr:MarR family transcriptional regulator [Thermoanaerobaculia bacterium]
MEDVDLLDKLRDDWQRERPDLETTSMGVIGRLVVLGGLLEKRASEALAPFDIGYTDLDVLATLRRSGSPFELRPAALLQAVLIQSGSMTACLDRLEKKGLVDRVATPEDRRGRAVRLTVRGRELIDRAIEVRFADADTSLEGLTDEERVTLEGLLRRLLSSNQTKKD